MLGKCVLRNNNIARVQFAFGNSFSVGFAAYREAARSAILIDSRAHQHGLHLALVTASHLLDHNCCVSLQPKTDTLFSLILQANYGRQLY